MTPHFRVWLLATNCVRLDTRLSVRVWCDVALEPMLVGSLLITDALQMCVLDLTADPLLIPAAIRMVVFLLSQMDYLPSCIACRTLLIINASNDVRKLEAIASVPYLL